VKIVPPNLTNLLQPLDVGVNRSFQQDYNSRYDVYIEKALDTVQLQTKAGNPKVPSYRLVSQWVLDWTKTRTSKSIAKAFQVCGIIYPDDFDVGKPHPPLRALYDDDFDQEAWEIEFSEMLDTTYADLPELIVSAPEYYLPDNETFSLFESIGFKNFGVVLMRRTWRCLSKTCTARCSI